LLGPARTKQNSARAAPTPPKPPARGPQRPPLPTPANSGTGTVATARNAATTASKKKQKKNHKKTRQRPRHHAPPRHHAVGATTTTTTAATPPRHHDHATTPPRRQAYDAALPTLSCSATLGSSGATSHARLRQAALAGRKPSSKLLGALSDFEVGRTPPALVWSQLASGRFQRRCGMWQGPLLEERGETGMTGSSDVTQSWSDGAGAPIVQAMRASRPAAFKTRSSSASADERALGGSQPS
jgi:hypothetical protein